MLEKSGLNRNLIFRCCLITLAIIAGIVSTGAAQNGANPPANWTMRQWEGNNTWTWTMSQLSPNTWNGHARSDQTGEQSDWKFTLTKVEGNRITLNRIGIGNYTETLSGDGKIVNGTCDFIGGGWSATLDR